ncbi:hypothetical protein A5634_24345 [Mycobacterium asiaticum]|uniref:Uncharacterized protein n=1 Tax=Mycobacterium asiaticum TaxID=1790 RepID=A0A1A3NYB6_MYCAS|nr:hypothetical protein [Mycobacterium asiaticum]OBK26936.1 hypothetical protein A5634_24345 [Mycobacterium asiaticum]
MAGISENDRIDDVAPGDLIAFDRAIDRGPGRKSYKVVFKDATEAGYVVTLEGNDGETFQVNLTAGTTVERALGSKWESAQSPTTQT